MDATEGDDCEAVKGEDGNHSSKKGADGDGGEGDAGTTTTTTKMTTTTRLCCLCPATKGPPPSSLPLPYTPELVKGKGVVAPPMGAFAGPFLPDRHGIATQWAHENCIMWCPEVYYDAKKGRLRKVDAALKRGARLKCVHCDLRGATVGCTLER